MKPINFEKQAWDILDSRGFRQGSGRASSRGARKSKKRDTRALKRGKAVGQARINNNTNELE